jgi:hypothetical protein
MMDLQDQECEYAFWNPAPQAGFRIYRVNQERTRQ